MATKEAKLQIVVDAQNKTQGTFNALSKNLDDIKQRHHGLQSALSAVGVAGAASAAGLALVTKSVIQAGASFEQTEIAFTTMLGSAEQAQKTLKELADFAAKTPFELPQLELASKQLLAYGTSAQDLIPTLKMLGDITAGVGMDKLPQLILAFGQVKAATKLTGTELRQFTEAGVPMLEALVAHFNKTGKAAVTVSNAAGLTSKEISKLGKTNATASAQLASLNTTLAKQQNRFKEMEKTGKTSSASYKNLVIDMNTTKRKIAEVTAEIAKNNGTLNLASKTVTSFGQAAKLTAADVQGMISDGAVSFADVQAALASMTGEGGKFFDLMEKQSRSLGGLWSTLNDNISLTARAIGQELVPYLKPVVEKLIEMTKAVGEFAKEHPKLTAAILIGSLAFAALLAVLLPIAIALPGLILLFSGIATAFAVVTAVSFPMLLAFAAIAAALTLLISQGYLTKDAWQDVWLGIQLIVAEASNAVISTVEAMVNFIIDGVNSAIKAINRVIAAAQKVPGLGKITPSLGLLDRAQFGKVDTDLIAAKDLAGRGNPLYMPPANIVNMGGNVFLSPSVAQDIGDMIIKQLKLSAQL